MKTRLSRYLFTVLFVLHTQGLLFSQESEPIYPSLDIKLPASFPKSFRYMNSSYALSPLPNEKGLDLLHASGSGQFNETHFQTLLEKLPSKNLIFIDLREESHGFVNGVAIVWKLANSTWTNIGMTSQQIDQDELVRLKRALQQKILILEALPKLDISQVLTEKQIVESRRLRYIRIPVTENHRPRDKEVDQFVNIIVNLKDTDWLHLHCRGGKGRTTLFLNMYDMLINVPAFKLSFREILDRQFLLGGTNFFNLRDPVDKKHLPAVERLEFLKRFYQYCSTSNPKSISWSEWLAQTKS